LTALLPLVALGSGMSGIMKPNSFGQDAYRVKCASCGALLPRGRTAGKCLKCGSKK
jgi:hypothetical protein